MMDILQQKKHTNLWQWLKNRKSYESPKKLNLRNIENFVIALWNKWFGKWKKEQAEWRREQVSIKSPECISKGECFCGCDLEGVLYQPLECTEKGYCFPKWMSKKEWIKFKNNNYGIGKN